MRQHALDLTQCRFTHTVGDITVYGTWYGTEINDIEPCLALMPTRRLAGVKPHVILLSSAYLYTDPAYLVRSAHNAAKAMGFEPGLSLTHRVANIIHDHLQDLIEMPPMPTENVVVGEGKLDGRSFNVTDQVQARS